MLFRRLNDELFTSADLTGAYEGSPLFILGGSPALSSLPLRKLEESRLLTMALNNVPYVYPNPTMWLTADKPACYGGHLFSRADIIKLAYMNYRDEVVEATGKPLKQHPMTLFYTAVSAVRPEDFFNEVPALAWWKSVFPISLQLAWRFGCRRVYLVGCSFTSSRATPYAWDVKLNDFEANWSQLTYNEDLVRLRQFQPLFLEHRFQVFSCTPGSRANDIFPTINLDDAIDHELMRMPKPTELGGLKHSSEFRPRGDGSDAAP